MQRKLTTARLESPLQLSFSVQSPVVTHEFRNLISKDILHEVAHIAFKASCEYNYISFEMSAITELESVLGIPRRQSVGFDFDLLSHSALAKAG